MRTDEISVRLFALIGDHSLAAAAADTSRVETIEALIEECGWEKILPLIIGLLEGDDRDDHWAVAAQLLWGAALGQRSMPIDRVIALLYFRFDPDGEDEDNLVWSITSKLKGVDYLSDYNPLKDAGVCDEMERLRRTF
jgi:hypothetical protein